MSVLSDQYLAGHGVGLHAGFAPGQTFTQTSKVQRASEYHTPGFGFGVPDSAISSYRDYRVTTAAEPVIGAGAANYQHYAANNSYGYGAPPVAVQNTYTTVVDNVVPIARHPRHRRQVFRLPDQPSTSRQVIRRLPTPEPDILERVYQQRQGSEVIEEITEVPTTPPPIIEERTVIEPSAPPQVIRRVVRVAPRVPVYSSYVPQVASYANVQSAQRSYPQYGSYSSYGGGYGAPSVNAGGCACYPAPQQGTICTSCSYPRAPVAPPAPIPGATCFYV